MKVFWKDTDLTDAESSLFTKVLVAHAQSVLRPNPSTAAIVIAKQGSGDYSKAIAAALMTIGGTHAPLKETIEFLASDEPPESLVNSALRTGNRIPGWGSSFTEQNKDPIWSDVESDLKTHFSWIADRIERVTAALHENGKQVFPNPSCYTAAACIAMSIPVEIAPYLFLIGRIDEWTKLFLDQNF